MSPNGPCAALDHLPDPAVKWTTIRRGTSTINTQWVPNKVKTYFQNVLFTHLRICQPSKCLSPIWSGWKIGNKERAASETSRGVQIDWIRVINSQGHRKHTLLTPWCKESFYVNSVNLIFSCAPYFMLIKCCIRMAVTQDWLISSS